MGAPNKTKKDRKPHPAEVRALEARGLYLAGRSEIGRAFAVAGAIEGFLAMLAVVLDDSTQLDVTNEQLQGMAEHLGPQARQLKSWILALTDTVAAEERMEPGYWAPRDEARQ